MKGTTISNQRSAKEKGRRLSVFGFTLIELLVVVTIIGLLAGLLLPVITGAIKRGEIAKAQHEVMALATAIQQYQAEYNFFPGQTTANSSSDFFYKKDNVSDLKNLLWTLQGTNINDGTWSNPRKLVFLEVDQHSVGASGAYNNCFVDPWGNPYQAAADFTFDNVIKDIADGGTASRSVAVWSWGPDPTKASDNPTEPTHIRSWK